VLPPSKETNMQVTFVVAGCKRQFDSLFRCKKGYEYVWGPEQLRGLHGIKVLRVGTYWLRDDVAKMEEAIRYAEFK
jgi:hypothetical protein